MISSAYVLYAIQSLASPTHTLGSPLFSGTTLVGTSGSFLPCASPPASRATYIKATPLLRDYQPPLAGLMEFGFALLTDPIMSASAPSSPSNRPRKRHSTSNKNQYPQTVMKNGRKYFLDDKSYSPYPLPCDVKELSRQTLWHELSRELWGGYSTINWDTEKLPDRVLDLGCGTGIWSAAMNEDFIKRGKKGTEFVGMDLMEGNQMDMRDVNWKFVKHNFLETPFPFEAETFDFVFMRDIMLGYPSKDMYSKIISEVLRIIKPGGLFEIQCSECTTFPAVLPLLQFLQSLTHCPGTSY